MKRGALCTSSTHPVNITTMRVEETQKACKGVSIKDVIIQFWLTQLLSHSWISISSAQTIHSASLHSVLLAIPLQHSRTQSPLCTHAHTPPSILDHNTVTSPHLFLIGLFGEANKATSRCDWIMQGNPGETPPILYVHLKTSVSNFHSLACMLHQTKTWLNRHFRCAGALLTLLCRRVTEETNQRREFLTLRTAVWFFICKSPSVQVEFKILKCRQKSSFWCIFCTFNLFFCFSFSFLFWWILRIWSVAAALTPTA